MKGTANAQMNIHPGFHPQAHGYFPDSGLASGADGHEGQDAETHPAGSSSSAVQSVGGNIRCLAGPASLKTSRKRGQLPLLCSTTKATDILSHSWGGWKLKTEVPTNSMSAESWLPGL